MKREEIIQHLHKNYSDFSNYILSLNEQDYMYSFQDEKWTPGQQNRHLILTTRPIALALILPGWMLNLIFGKSKRASRTYKGLVKKYKSRLKLRGGKVNKSFVPSPVKYHQKEALAFQLLKIVQTIIKRFKTYTEDQIEEIILPHPLLGKITIKEMMYFTIYHASHHLDLTKKYLDKGNTLVER